MRLGRTIGALTAAAILGCVAGCTRGSTSPAAPAGVFFPRLTHHSDTWPLALASGTLIEMNGCVFLAPDEGGSSVTPPGAAVAIAAPLLIWPTEARAEQPTGGALQILIDDKVVAQVGDRVELGGGYVGESKGDLSQAESLIGGQIPAQCQTPAGYFLTSGPA